MSQRSERESIPQPEGGSVDHDDEDFLDCSLNKAEQMLEKTSQGQFGKKPRRNKRPRLDSLSDEG